MPAKTSKKKSSAPPPPPPPPRPPTLEERAQALEARLAKADPGLLERYQRDLDVSWIMHCSALEGTAYTVQELRAAFDLDPPLSLESNIQPVVEEVKRHREALAFVRDAATKKKQPVTLDLVKQIYCILHPEEGDYKTVKFRKDIPQHRLYFHEYAPPDKIATKMRQVIDFIHDPEAKKARSPLRLATRAHYDMLRIFPFAEDSGKVARLFLNLLLLRSGYPPAIIHSTERQRYYEALKGSSANMNTIVQEAIENGLASVEKLMDTYEGRRR